MTLDVLYDADIQDFLTYRGAIDVLEALVRSKLTHNVVHPPRHLFPTIKGSMTFTIGELIQERVAGFRLYGAPKTTQITVVMDTHTGEFKGLIVGKLIGVFRTACLNAVAIKHLARQDAKTLGVLGSGFQAKHHTLAALQVRDISKVVVFSRNAENRNAFIRFVGERAGDKDMKIVSAESSEAVVEQSDILICASNSGTPILPSSALKEGLHINNVGPKYKGRSELPISFYENADVLTTDSLSQLYEQGGANQICFEETIPPSRVRGLEHYMSDFERRPEDITLFCSMGLAGSEVALANWVLEGVR